MFLLTANWFIGGARISAIALLMIARTPLEKKIMIETVGDEYRRYIEGTHKFIP